MRTLFETLFELQGASIHKYLTKSPYDPKHVDSNKDLIFNYHYNNNSKYYDWVGEEKVKSWNDVPILEKRHLQSGHKEWISNRYANKKLFQNTTSGSSGIPLRFVKDWDCHARTWALVFKRYEEHGIDIFRDLEARFYGIPLNSTLAFLKEKSKDRIARRFRFSVFDLSDVVLGKYYNSFQKKKFVYLNGYTNSLLAFSNYIIRHQYLALKEICPTLKVCITTSEMCSEQDRATMEQAFGVKIINEYGAAELDVIAIEDIDGDWVLNDENLYVEVVDDNNQPVPNGSNKYAHHR